MTKLPNAALSRYALLLGIFLLASCAAPSASVRNTLGLDYSSPESVGIDSTRLERLTQAMQGFVDEGKLAGVVTAAARDGKIFHFESVGQRDLASGDPMENDDLFRIYSMTKPITGVALMILYEEGKFKLSDPVAMYIPEFTDLQVYAGMADDGTMLTEPADHPMTMRELMSHTGGLLYTPPLSQGPVANAYAEAGIMDLTGTSLADSVPALKDIPLGYQPGTQWVYSISVDVQGYMVERLSGMSFGEFLQQRLFDPLGMVDTGFYVKPENAHRLSRQYAPNSDGTLRRTDNRGGIAGGYDFLSAPVFESGGGGLTSTAADYLQFVQMHLNKGMHNGQRLLSEEAIDEMRSNQLPDAVEGIGAIYPGNVFGLDFAIVENSAAYQGASVGTHWWWGIAGSWFWIDPVENLVFIGMIQNDDIMYSLQTHAASRAAIYR